MSTGSASAYHLSTTNLTFITGQSRTNPSETERRSIMRTRGAAKRATEKATETIMTATKTPGHGPPAAMSTHQTRLSFRLSKSSANIPQHGKSKQQEDRPDIKALEPPSKRRRVTKAQELTISETSLLSRTTERSEDTTTVTTTEATLELTARKLLIINGAVVKDGSSQKAGASSVTADTTQILDPDFKIQIQRGPSNPSGLTPGFSPYPYRKTPAPEACEEVYRILAEAHGEIKPPVTIPPASMEVAGCGEVPCLLDALMRTIISGNTMMPLANTAIRNVAKHYGIQEFGTGKGSINWDKVRLGSHDELAAQVRCAGNGPTKTKHMKTILDMVYKENSAMVSKNTSDNQVLLSLNHLRNMSKDEAMARLVAYPGIGIKTAACVTLFCLQIPCFAVDTHVLRFCQWLGWVPYKADADNCFRHGDVMVPDHLKYGLHQLFIQHGQRCFKCRKATKPGTKEWREAPDCPLEHLLDRKKDIIDGGAEEN